MTTDFETAQAVALRLVEAIAERHPSLDIAASERSFGELSWILPVQPGIKHEIWLAFSNNDEVHFGVANFWIEYFPCTDPEQGERFVDAVSGFIDGRYRIIEHYRGERCVRADLQRPQGDGWETLATWGRLHWPLPISKTYQAITNT
jgi:hypothetical protein